MVITFANQKGGVGKTTLCMLFANYLVKRGINVLVVDIDLQKSIVSQRKSDRAVFNDQEEEYNVEGVDIDTQEEANVLMEKCKALDGVVLIDAPGTVADNTLLPVFVNSDYVICPYQYERKCLESTGVFVQLIEALKKKVSQMKLEVFFVPNHIDAKVGTKEEKELWQSTDDVFRRFGYVTERIPYKASIMRSNTFVLDKRQEADVMPCFDQIINVTHII